MLAHLKMAIHLPGSRNHIPHYLSSNFQVGIGDDPTPPDPVLHDFLWNEHPVTQNQITLNDQIDQISPPLIVRHVLAQG